MTEPTEEEVKAVQEVFSTFEQTGDLRALKPRAELVRAALTAAAQVRARAETSEVDRLRRDCAELYQVIGTMAEHCSDPEHPAIIKALDNASAAAAGDPRRHDDLLPFILPAPVGEGPNEAMARIGLMPIYGATEDLQQDLVQATTEPAETSRDHPRTEISDLIVRLQNAEIREIPLDGGKWLKCILVGLDLNERDCVVSALTITQAPCECQQSDWNREIAAPAPGTSKERE